jgi:hypothetical protein
VALLTTEFEKLGLRVGWKTLIRSFESRSKHWKSIVLNVVFDVVNSKNISKRILQAQFLKTERKMQTLKISTHNTLMQLSLQLKAKGKLNMKWNQIKWTLLMLLVLYSTIKDSDVYLMLKLLISWRKWKKIQSRRIVKWICFDRRQSFPADEAS